MNSFTEYLPVSPSITGKSRESRAQFMYDGEIIVPKEPEYGFMSEQERAMTKVLIVDDDPLVMRLLSVHTESRGFNVQGCTDPQEALNLVEAGGIDLVVTDLEMPEMNGWDLAKRIRESDDGEFIQIVIVSARAGENEQEKAKQLGIDNLFDKALLDMNQLVEKIEALAVKCRNEKYDASWSNFANNSDIFN